MLPFITMLVLTGFLYFNDGSFVKREEDFFRINITMNSFKTTQQDQYAYVRYELPDEELNIIGYVPLINMNSAHHMLTYACENPGSGERYWTFGSSCGGGEEMIIHGWARNAPAFSLPENVSVSVGRNTPFKHIVVNIHYFSILHDDYSGNQLIFTRKPRKYNAGVMLGGTNNIHIKPKTHNVRSSFNCRYDGPPLSIFAVRVHAHQWARVNSLFRIRNGKISQIAKGDPQWPQSFYPVPIVDIVSGDYIAGQCIYDNDEDRTISVGATHNDEMCNVYAMYSYEPFDSQNNKVLAPFRMCWDVHNGELLNLIPTDADIRPKTPTDIGGDNVEVHKHTDHTMVPSKAIIYNYVENWPNLKSLSTNIGEIGGIALSNDGTELVVFHRGSRKWEFKYFDGVRFRNEEYGPIKEDVLIHIDTKTGKEKSRWGANMFYLPHGLTIDDQGNYWLTDIAMHQVFMFQPTNLTHPALVIGKAFQSGSGSNYFCRPADVAVLTSGDIFVADGYCNNRIAKFNRKGEYISEWGSPTTGISDENGFNAPNEFNVVHSIALNEKAKIICAADRENNRIQCFDLVTGIFQQQISVEKKRSSDSFFAIEFVPKSNESILFAVTGGTSNTKKVYMIDVLQGKILTSFESNPNMMAPHDITVSANALEVYVGELSASTDSLVHKFQTSISTDLPNKTYDNRKTSNDENFRTSIWIMIVFAIPIVIAITVGFLVRFKSLDRENKLNGFVSNDPEMNDHKNSMFDILFQRKDGFRRLGQESDDDHDQFQSHADNNSNENSDNETVTLPSNLSTVLPMSKNQT